MSKKYYGGIINNSKHLFELLKTVWYWFRFRTQKTKTLKPYKNKNLRFNQFCSIYFLQYSIFSFNFLETLETMEIPFNIVGLLNHWLKFKFWSRKIFFPRHCSTTLWYFISYQCLQQSSSFRRKSVKTNIFLNTYFKPI